jgi:pimeloyl-ACP methyl ester carboxylesterase
VADRRRQPGVPAPGGGLRPPARPHPAAAGGGLVHGSDLYGTANAARDLADVLAALRTGRVDLYGDSYGSRFAQTFAARYPGLLRSVTLDATWPVLGTDPFYLSTPQTMRIAFDLACRRSVACSAAAPGRSMERIAALAERLRRAPVVGRTREPGGPPATWRVDIGAAVGDAIWRWWYLPGSEGAGLRAAASPSGATRWSGCGCAASASSPTPPWPAPRPGTSTAAG